MPPDTKADVANVPQDDAPDTNIKGKGRERCRNFMLEQQIAYLKPGYQSLSAMNELVEKAGAKNYAGILHDKDPGVTPHIHIFMEFEHPREVGPLAKKLLVKHQYIKKWDDGIENGYRYLLHHTKKARAKGKYQYDPAEVEASFDYIKKLEEYDAKAARKKARTGNEQQDPNTSTDPKFLLDCLYVGELTRKEVEARLSGSQYARYHRQIEDICAKRLRDEADRWRAEMKEKGKPITVIWISGSAGVGKSHLAVEYANRKGQPFYSSGSGRDPWQEYEGEHTIILDELRPDIIPYRDLLLLLDPFGYGKGVMGGARFHDKAIAADLIIITSPYNPEGFYNNMRMSDKQRKIDTFEQLLRRIALCIEMTETTIAVAKWSRTTNWVWDMSTRKQNPYSKSDTGLDTNGVAIYEDMLAGVANIPPPKIGSNSTLNTKHVPETERTDYDMEVPFGTSGDDSKPKRRYLSEELAHYESPFEDDEPLDEVTWDE